MVEETLAKFFVAGLMGAALFGAATVLSENKSTEDMGYTIADKIISYAGSAALGAGIYYIVYGNN